MWTVVAIDAAGNTSEPSEAFELTLRRNTPTLVAPSELATDEDTLLAFAGDDRITVGDHERNELTVSRSVSSGELFVAEDSNLTFEPDTGPLTPTLVFSATLEEANAALEGLAYLPDLDFHGEDVLEIVLTDVDTSIAGSVALTVVPVDDAPVLGELEAVETLSGTATDWIALEISDVDTDVSELVVAASAEDESLLSSEGVEIVFEDGVWSLRLTPLPARRGRHRDRHGR